MGARMRIAIFTFDEITMFHLSVPLMVFGEVSRLGLATDWETRLWSSDGGSIRTAEGYPIGGISGPEIVEDADIVIVPSWSLPVAPAGPELRGQLASAHGRGATIAGLCLGAFPLADAGLLDGRAAVTHWTAMSLLAERRRGV